MNNFLCPKCESASFEAKTVSIVNLSFDLAAIQCRSCGSLIGITGVDVLGDHIAKCHNKVIRQLRGGTEE